MTSFTLLARSSTRLFVGYAEDAQMRTPPRTPPRTPKRGKGGDDEEDGDEEEMTKVWLLSGATACRSRLEEVCAGVCWYAEYAEYAEMRTRQ